jgi:hypothetical protein
MGKKVEVGSYPVGISVEAVSCVATKGTADAPEICRCDDGSDYAVKGALTNRHLPHQEWFCMRLGELAGLISPPIRIVKANGHHCFGSRWESGDETGLGYPDGWWVRAHAKEIDFALLAPTISRIFAFDLFVHNVDRHLFNYIVRKQKLGHTILALDYSQAWLWNGFPLPPLPIQATTNTIVAMRILRRMFGDFISINDVQHVCHKLIGIKNSQVEAIIHEHPLHWLTDAQRNDIFLWWESDERLVRIAQVEEGIKNGTFL